MTTQAENVITEDDLGRTYSYRRIARRTAWLLLAGFVLLACDLQSQHLLLPAYIEGLSRVLYKLFFFITLPFRSIVVFLIPREHHHWPLAHHIVTSLGAPFFLYGLWRVGRALGRVRRDRRPQPATLDDVQMLNRRQFLVRSSAGVACVATGGVGGYASLIAPEDLRIRHYEIGVRNLPAFLDGVRIVHVSDTHYGPFVSMPYLEQVFARANSLSPDLVLLTGDYVHYTPDSVEPGIAALAKLNSRFGSVAVMGNHEHWEGAEACRRQFREIGLPLVDNTRLFLTPEGIVDTPVAGRSLCLAGVGDMWEDEVSFDKALHAVPSEMPRVLLSHNPDTAEVVDPRHRIDLMLSGHTHGGQIAFPIIGAPVCPSNFGNRYLGGLCSGPSFPVIVSRGVGLAGVPLRLGVPPELGLIVLVRA